jgi:hypothetical protein
VEIGRQHARNFDAGHAPSGGATQRVLAELRKLAERTASQAATTATPVSSALDDIRARRDAQYTAYCADSERPIFAMVNHVTYYPPSSLHTV